MSLQYIFDDKGNPQYVILPVAEFNQLNLSNEDKLFRDVPYQPDEYDNETIPNEVVNIMFDQNVSLLAAWRIYRKFSQYQVAEATGLTQSAIAQAENKSSKPQLKTRERLAKIYDCTPEQLVL